ncbi:hypothetical protein HDU88_003436 [Geranomyces variabilis]|nr:hypothetical protein HDU88_003436 [Geranomyces variabilis]
MFIKGQAYCQGCGNESTRRCDHCRQTSVCLTCFAALAAKELGQPRDRALVSWGGDYDECVACQLCRPLNSQLFHLPNIPLFLITSFLSAEDKVALSQAHPALRKRDVSPEATFVGEIRKLIFERSKSGAEPERICAQNDRWDSTINALRAIRVCPANSRVLRCDQETLGWGRATESAWYNEGTHLIPHVASIFDVQVATPLPPPSAGQFAVLRLYGSQSSDFGGSHAEYRGSIELPGTPASECGRHDYNDSTPLVHEATLQAATRALSLPNYSALSTLATTLFNETFTALTREMTRHMCENVFGIARARMEDERERVLKPTLAAAPCPVQLDQWDQRLTVILDRFTQRLHRLRERTKHSRIPNEHWQVTGARNLAAWRVTHLAIDELKRNLRAQKAQVVLSASAVEAAYVALGGARDDMDRKLAWVAENIVIHAAERHDTKIEYGRTILDWGACELRVKVQFIDPSLTASRPKNAGSEKASGESDSTESKTSVSKREDRRARFSKGGALVASASTIFKDQSWKVDPAALDTLADRLGTAPFGWSREELVVLLYAVGGVVLSGKYATDSTKKGPLSPSAKKDPLSPFPGRPILFVDLKTVPTRKR